MALRKRTRWYGTIIFLGFLIITFQVFIPAKIHAETEPGSTFKVFDPSWYVFIVLDSNDPSAAEKSEQYIASIGYERMAVRPHYIIAAIKNKCAYEGCSITSALGVSNVIQPVSSTN